MAFLSFRHRHIHSVSVENTPSPCSHLRARMSRSIIDNQDAKMNTKDNQEDTSDTNLASIYSRWRKAEKRVTVRPRNGSWIQIFRLTDPFGNSWRGGVNILRKVTTLDLASYLWGWICT